LQRTSKGCKRKPYLPKGAGTTLVRDKKMKTIVNNEYLVELRDPANGNYVAVTSKLAVDGQYCNYSDETGSWSEITADPEFCDYNYEDLDTGSIGIMPEAWKPLVDLILINVYWDRELDR
jgi:hypothetical protein